MNEALIYTDEFTIAKIVGTNSMLRAVEFTDVKNETFAKIGFNMVLLESNCLLKAIRHGCKSIEKK